MSIAREARMFEAAERFPLGDPTTRDPDLDQAIEDLRPVAAELREAKRALRTMAEAAPMNSRFAAQQRVSELRMRIVARAARIGIAVDALHIILNEEAQLRARQRRRPARKFMVKALDATAADAARHLGQLRSDLERLQRELASAERYHAAADGARRAYSGLPR